MTYTYGQNGAGKHAVTSLSDGTTMTYDANGNLTVMTDLAKTQYYTYDTSNRLTMVEAVDAGTTTRYPVASFTYDGDGGRTTKTAYPNKGATSVTTRYVGDLYESSGGAQTDYIFMGGTRVAAYDASGAKCRWFIGDNLGSTNVVLDETSAVKERIEYTPWGEVKSYDKYGTSSEVAWFYFTGKRLDDETGLVYFGARYYNPKLARFITADSIVQSPYNPQTLNRYSYCNNNPVNLVDPTGHSWTSFFKAVVDNFKFFSNPVKSDPLIHGIVTGDWSYAARVGTAAVSAFVCSGFNPISAASAAMTEVFMTSPMGQWTTQEVGEHFFDNALGMRPSTAYIWSYMTVSTTASLTFEHSFANMTAEQGTVHKFNRNNPQDMNLLDKDGYGYNTYADETMTNPGKDSAWFVDPNKDPHVYVITGSDGKAALVGDQGYILGSVHTGADSPNFPQALNMKNPSSLPFQKLTTFGICHQAANATLLASGFSNTVMQISGNYSTYLTTAIYGNYGGGLVQKVYNGSQAKSNWKGME